MKTGYWVIRTYEAGRVGEKIKYWVPGERVDRRSKQRERTEIKKQEQNEYSCVKRAARILNANFRQGDVLLGLDYSDEGLAVLERTTQPTSADADEGERMDAVRRAAEHQLRLCLRRVKRALHELGEDLSVFAVTSDMDGDTGETVRIHHHLVIPAGAETAFRAKWRLGGVFAEPLSGQADYTPVAEYLLRQVRRVPDEKKYMTSRNLIRPEPKDRVVLNEAELRVPKGGQLLYRGAHTLRSPQYIRYILPGKGEADNPPGQKGYHAGRSGSAGAPACQDEGGKNHGKRKPEDGRVQVSQLRSMPRMAER